MFIQSEETPNPATMKFIPGLVLLKTGTLEFKSKKQAEKNSLAKQLFSENNVKGVFIGKDFLTITKSDEVEWESLKPSILSTILDFFSSGGSIDSELKQKPESSDKKREYSKKDLERKKDAKNILFERLNADLRPLRENYKEIIDDRVKLEKTLKEGAIKARGIASKLIEDVRHAVGIKSFVN